MPKFMSLFLADICCLRNSLDPTLASANKQFASLLPLQFPYNTKMGHFEFIITTAKFVIKLNAFFTFFTMIEI